jgi:GR25 family glycosyltransferase involved in LPS biosynthesis
MSIPIYVVNYKNEERKQRMSHRFHQMGLYAHYVSPVSTKDSRLDIIQDGDKRVYSIMLQHLDSLSHFVEHTDAEHCIVCEDDIKISKHLAKDLPDITRVFDEQKMDVLLLGFLFPYRISPDENHYFARITESVCEDRKYDFLQYPDDLWGSQMYMMSREHARKLVAHYTPDYVVRPLSDGESRIPYSPDWILTKCGKRGLIYPMMAVEEGDSPLGHPSHEDFHHRCHVQNYVEGLHL